LSCAQTPELLQRVADAYRGAAPRQRNAAVGKVIGRSTHAASYYFSRARKQVSSGSSA